MKNKNKHTKFPVARIKKIMQKDEEVGKVAQATPIVISKALEMFLAMIIDESSKVSTQRGSKKVEAYHLKHAVETTEILDFLKEIVQGVADPSAGGTIDVNGESADGGKKKRRSKKATPAGGNAESGAPPRKRKKKGDVQARDTLQVEGEAETEGRSEQEGGDMAIDDGDEYDDKRIVVHGEPSYDPRLVDSGEVRWRDAIDDEPYVPT